MGVSPASPPLPGVDAAYAFENGYITANESLHNPLFTLLSNSWRIYMYLIEISNYLSLAHTEGTSYLYKNALHERILPFFAAISSVVFIAIELATVNWRGLHGLT